MRMQLAPRIDGKVNDHQTGCGQSFIEPLARLHIPRCDQGSGEVVKTGIVADDK